MDREAQSSGDRLWAGNVGAVAKARRNFLHGDQAKGLLPFACALYSFRDRPQYAHELRGLRRKLLRHAETLIVPDADAYHGSHWAERADMLTTYLAWLSAQPVFSNAARGHLRSVAIRICETCLPEARSLTTTERAHSYYLLALTYVSLTITERQARGLLLSVQKGAPRHVRDRKQKVRIYAKLGLLFRKLGEAAHASDRFRGLWWGVRAVALSLAWRLPLNVTAKAGASLMGIQR